MLTSKGYVRKWYGDRLRMEHDVVWERNFGAIPDGYCIHHIDHNKLNNSIDNLLMLTKEEHASLHAEEVVPADTPAIDILIGGYP